jgi:hypothetical protein
VNHLLAAMRGQAEEEQYKGWVRGAGVGIAPTYTLSNNTAGATYYAASAVSG